jgi:hypothetical protein
VGTSNDAAGIELTLARERRRVGVTDPLVTLRMVDQLERQTTGKIRRFVPLAAVRA